MKANTNLNQFPRICENGFISTPKLCKNGALEATRPFRALELSVFFSQSSMSIPCLLDRTLNDQAGKCYGVLASDVTAYAGFRHRPTGRAWRFAA